MKKNKKVIFGVSVFLVLVVVCVFFVYSKNKNTMQTPFDELADTINQKDLGKIPGLFHESCSLSIEEKLSQEKFDEFMDAIIDECGENTKAYFVIKNIEEDETNDLLDSSNGNDLKVEAVYNVEAQMRVEEKPIKKEGVTVGESKDHEGGTFWFSIVKINGEYYFNIYHTLRTAFFDTFVLDW